MAHGNYFKLRGPNGLFCNFSPLLMECDGSHRQYANEWVWLCSNKTLLTPQSEFHIIFTGHEILFLFFFLALKMWKLLQFWIAGLKVIRELAVGWSWLAPVLKLKLYWHEGGPGTRLKTRRDWQLFRAIPNNTVINSVGISVFQKDWNIYLLKL